MTGARSRSESRGAGRAPQPRPGPRPSLTSTFATAPQPRPTRTHTAPPRRPIGGARGARPGPNTRMNHQIEATTEANGVTPMTNFHHGQEASSPKWGAAYDQPVTWRDYANCRGVDTSAVFYDDDPNYAVARKLCASCTVRADCLADALADKFAAQGFRGGKTPPERKELRRRQRRNQLTAVNPRQWT